MAGIVGILAVGFMLLFVGICGCGYLYATITEQSRRVSPWG